MRKRSRTQLEFAVSVAKNAKIKAMAYYNLGIFHDNNAREALALPNYRKALSLGLSGVTKSRCFAWFVSSLYKTGKYKEALRNIQQSQKITKDKQLLKFLTSLKQRITRNSSIL